ncbi:MAG: cytochrome c [Vicinamibacterales bacterium]
MRGRARCLVSVAVMTAAAVACSSRPLPTVREGRALYGENGCASCHGHSGHGDGPVGLTLDPRPRDFRDMAAFKRGYDLASIAHTLATGILVDGPAVAGAAGAPEHHQQGMPKFDHLSESERQSLALYVMSLHRQTRQGALQP